MPGRTLFCAWDPFAGITMVSVGLVGVGDGVGVGVGVGAAVGVGVGGGVGVGVGVGEAPPFFNTPPELIVNRSLAVVPTIVPLMTMVPEGAATRAEIVAPLFTVTPELETFRRSDEKLAGSPMVAPFTVTAFLTLMTTEPITVSLLLLFKVSPCKL